MYIDYDIELYLNEQQKENFYKEHRKNLFKINYLAPIDNFKQLRWEYYYYPPEYPHLIEITERIL